MNAPTLTITEKAEACLEWVENGLGKALEEDPSGFLAGIESVPVVLALEEIVAHLRDLEPPREPTDDEIYNRHGVEGGIAYDTTADQPGSLGENDWRL